jgi:hypothetical protein
VLRHYATRLEIAGLIHVEMNYVYIYIYILMFLTLSAALGNGFHSAPNRNDFQKKKDNMPGK